MGLEHCKQALVGHLEALRTFEPGSAFYRQQLTFVQGYATALNDAGELPGELLMIVNQFLENSDEIGSLKRQIQRIKNG